MKNIAILGLVDFENWNNEQSKVIGGSSGVIRSILPFLDCETIYLLGITSDRSKLNKEIYLNEKLRIVAISYSSFDSKIPTRLKAFWYSRKINYVMRKYKIQSVYSHAEEMSFWLKSDFKLLYHMHGSANALVQAKNRLFRFKLLQYAWEKIRITNLQKATGVIAIDTLCYNLAVNHCSRKNITLLPNFVDSNIFYRDQTPSLLLEHINENILLFVGRIEEVKGLELFVDTLIEINSRNDGKWKGVFVGLGTYESEIMRFISKKLANHLFYFAGPVFDQNELRKIYSRASILMISSYFEGIPMAILESLACGTPVISTNVGGIKEFIADDKMCFVNNSRNPLEFASIIQSILNNKSIVQDEFRFSTERAAKLINSYL